MEGGDEYIKKISFGNYTFCAQASRINLRRHVHRLIIPTYLAWVISWLPSGIRLWLGRRGFLPTVAILKERNPDRPEEHAHERDVYRKLESLQGDHIPLLYGEVTVNDGEKEVPALLLESVCGTTLNRLSPEHLESIEARKIIDSGNDPNDELTPDQILNPRLVKALRNIFDELGRKGVVHGDPRADNFIATVRTDGSYKVVAIDFEFPHTPSDETNAMGLLSVIYELAGIVAPEVL